MRRKFDRSVRPWISGLLTMEQIERKLGVSRTTFWRIRKHDETFPPPVRLNSGGQRGIKRWHRRDIDAWIRMSMEEPVVRG